jgi:glucan 1,3-beta-glucosidase
MTLASLFLLTNIIMTGPGSQNGFDNSGRKGAIGWGQGDTVAQTLNAVRALAQRYASNTGVVTSIELLNEPLPPGVNLDILRQFYNDGFGNIRAVNGETAVTLSDAFQGPSAWNGFFPGNNIIMDTHIYQVFDVGLLQQNPNGFIGTACGKVGQLLQADKWTIVGEWCGALTDCAKWLNGRYNGARYDGTFGGSPTIGSCAGKYSGSVDALSGDDKYNIRRYIEAQLDAYEAKTGWVYWTWKTEGAPEWDMQQQLAGGLFPQPLTDRRYPGQCARSMG